MVDRVRPVPADLIACAEMALADEFEGLLVDLDGVVWIGRELVPGLGRGAAGS